jgi:hypothetical protein
MSVLTVHPSSEAEEQALKALFDTFKVKYEKELDETDYLNASENNRKALDEGIRQVEAGEVVKISLEDLWK